MSPSAIQYTLSYACVMLYCTSVARITVTHALSDTHTCTHTETPDILHRQTYTYAHRYTQTQRYIHTGTDRHTHRGLSSCSMQLQMQSYVCMMFAKISYIASQLTFSAHSQSIQVDCSVFWQRPGQAILMHLCERSVLAHVSYSTQHTCTCYCMYLCVYYNALYVRTYMHTYAILIAQVPLFLIKTHMLH